MFQTNTPITGVAGHYYSVSVDVVYACGFNASDPQMGFQIVDGGTPVTIGTPVNGCTGGTNVVSAATSRPGGGTMNTRVATLQSNAAYRLVNGTFDIRMYNNNGITNGNDGGFDNIQVLDVTPALDKSFAPPLVGTNKTSTLTFTITNTTELSAKPDWSFVDTLPVGVVVAPLPNVGGTCVNAAGVAFVRTATAGSGTISVTGGDLAIGQSSCTITVDVVSGAGVQPVWGMAAPL